MTTIFIITTAVCFVGWIKAEVQRHICKGGWANAISWKYRIEEERDKLRIEVGELETSRDYYERRANEGGAVARSRTVERDELHKTLARVAEAIKIQETAREELGAKRKELYQGISGCVRFLDDFVAEHPPGELSDLSDEDFFKDGLETDTKEE